MVHWVWLPITAFLTMIFTVCLIFRVGPSILFPEWRNGRSRLRAKLLQKERAYKKLSDKLGAKQGV